MTAPPQRSICGRLSVALFVVTIAIFAHALRSRSRQSENSSSAYVALATMGTALAGLVLGVAGRVRKERDRDWVIAGIVLNGAWLACGGIILVIGYMIFGGSRGSDWH